MKNERIERICVEGGTLIIRRQDMMLQTPDGAMVPADLDCYEPYLPVMELMGLIPSDASITDTITAETKELLYLAFTGRHPLLSEPLYCSTEYTERNEWILEMLRPETEADYVRAFSLICANDVFCREDALCPFACREEVREHLCAYMDEEVAYQVSEAVRKGMFYSGPEGIWSGWETYKSQVEALPKELLDAFSKICYLPKRSVMELITRYAILAANALLHTNH